MNMIEKVAIAIGGLENDRCNPCTTKKIIKCKECLQAAKSIITAMREPTDAMIAGTVNIDWSSASAEDIYKSMIDGALKDK